MKTKEPVISLVEPHLSCCLVPTQPQERTFACMYNSTSRFFLGGGCFSAKLLLLVLGYIFGSEQQTSCRGNVFSLPWLL